MTQTIGKRSFKLAACCGVSLALSQLFMGAAWGADDAATIADLKARLAGLERDVSQLVDGAGKSSGDVGIPVHGFADVVYSHADENETRLNQAGRGFSATSLDFYLTPQFGDNTKALIELIFEFASDGGLATDLERIQFGHIFNDQLTVWMGRFHAPYGYWNTGFHHGAEIQTSVLRPRFIDFEDKGGLLPSHVMGAWATGGAPVGDSRLTYSVYVGNGNSMNLGSGADGGHDGSLDINNSRDSNSNKLVGVNLGYEIGNLVLGAHAFTEKVTLINDIAVDVGVVDVKMTGLYGFYENDNLEAIAEYYHFSNDDLINSTGSHSSELGFVQVGYAVGDDWMPYIRAEKGSLDQNDPYFNSQEYGYSYDRQAVGLRYTLNPKAALKLELMRTKEGDGVSTSPPNTGSYSEAKLQYSIRF